MVGLYAGAYLTLCAACNAAIRLTDAQAVVAEAELTALDVVSLAFCPSCRADGQGRHAVLDRG
jgi:hypothetical protein